MGSHKRSRPNKRDEDHRTLRGRIGAYSLHALYDPRITTAAARSAFNDRFYRDVDPDGVLPEGERQRRAQAAKKAYFSRLAYLSAKARAKRRSRDKATRHQHTRMQDKRHNKVPQRFTAAKDKEDA